MNKLVNDNKTLCIEELILKAPSFQKIINDGIITQEEIQEQTDRVVTILKKLETICSDEQLEVIKSLLAELSVLTAICSKKKYLDQM